MRRCLAGRGEDVRRWCGHQILERALYGMINEGARILEEGVALRAADIDVIYMNGYGFPTWRGGPMFYAETVGLPKILERVTAFYKEHGDRWKPADLLRRLSETGKTFQHYDVERGV